VDESFAGSYQGYSLAPEDGLIVLRSFGKFFGLAGIRLGFALGSTPITAAMAQLARRHIWSRIFPYSLRWPQLGMPGCEAERERLAAALGRADALCS